MTLSSFVVRNTFRNKRRSILTLLSISFSLLLLTLMMSIWRTFYIDQGPPDSVKRIITRDRVSLTFFLPAYYRDKIRSVPGVVAVVPMTYFGNHYKDDRSANAFAQVATDPEEYPKVAADKIVPPEQLLAWQRDRTGALVDIELAKKYGWKIGDRVTLRKSVFPGAARAHDPGDVQDRSPGSVLDLQRQVFRRVGRLVQGASGVVFRAGGVARGCGAGLQGNR